MARVGLAEIPEFTRSGRMVVLLTLREAEALVNVLPKATGSEDANRARRVLSNQVLWLRANALLSGVDDDA